MYYRFFQSLNRYGTDTYIFLPRLGNQRESEEMLNNYLYWTTLRSTMTIPTNVV